MTNPKVDAYIGRSVKWPEEMAALRSVLLGCGLTEEIKWGKPCYSSDKGNIAIMQEMKDFLALMFFKGALLTDPDGLLESQGPNSRSALRVCFRSTADVRRLTKAVKAFVAEAFDVEDAGLEVAPAPALELVAELRDEEVAAGGPGRRPDWRAAVDSGMLDHIRAGQLAEAKERLEACLSSSSD